MPTYPGGKNGPGVYQTLINLMPPHDVYIEPFLGGGAIMRLKRPAALNIGTDLVLSPGMAPPAASGRNGETPAAAPPAAMEASRASDGDTAGSIAKSGPSSPLLARGSRIAAPAPFSASGPGAFEFHQCDGIAFLERYPFTGRELVYCDPPYLMETRSGRRLYEHEMDAVDHRRLLRVVMKLDCMVMISGYSSPMYAKELRRWNAASYQTTTRGGRAVAEWVWFNYPRPVELHDYRYLGENFRERANLRRQQKRWKGKLERMNTLQRQALLCAIAESAGFGDARSTITKTGEASSFRPVDYRHAGNGEDGSPTAAF